ASGESSGSAGALVTAQEDFEFSDSSRRKSGCFRNCAGRLRICPLVSDADRVSSELARKNHFFPGRLGCRPGELRSCRGKIISLLVVSDADRVSSELARKNHFFPG